MPRGNCAICTHSQRDAIDAALTAGSKLKPLAAQHSVSAYSLSRHKAKHLLADAPEVDTDSLQAKIDLWSERANRLWQQAELDADTRAQAQAVAAGLRSVEFQSRRAERTPPPEENAGGNDALTIPELDKFCAWQERVIHETEERTSVLARDSAKRLRQLDLFEIFETLIANLTLKQRVIEFCQTLFAEEQSRNELVSQTHQHATQ